MPILSCPGEIIGNFISRISFGSKINQHYYDKIGFYKNLNHLDDKRREKYYKRFGKEAKPDTAKYFSHNYLW